MSESTLVFTRHDARNLSGQLNRQGATDDSSAGGNGVDKPASNGGGLHSEFQDVLEALSANWSEAIDPKAATSAVKTDGVSKNEKDKKPQEPPKPLDDQALKSQPKLEDPAAVNPAPGKPLDVAKLAERLEDNFKRIDKNKDGFVSDAELFDAVRNPAFKGEDALLVGLLKISKPNLHANPIAHLHRDTELGLYDQEKGISRADAKIYLELLSLSSREGMSLKRFMERIHEEFSNPDFHRAVNPDSDKLITDDELKAARKNPKMTESAKTLIDLLLRNREALTKLSTEKVPSTSLTFDALRDFRDLSEVMASSERPAHSILERYRTEGNVSRELFADKAKPINSIKPEAVKQGGVGDCFFLSVVGSLATHDPEQLLSMIKTTDKGDFEVRFPGAKGKVVTVARPTDAELFLYAGATEHGIWVSVLERAYGTLLKDNPEFRTETYIDTDSPENLDGGGRDEALKLLTGANTKDHEILRDTGPELKKLKAELAEAKKRGDIAIAATLADAAWVQPDLQPGHAYTVTDFDESTITVRNAWGVVRLGEKNGMPIVRQGDTGNLKLTHEEFANKFGNIVFAPSRKK
ncbi:MAG: hypothetical protein K2X93_21860 [Candidatus Obscuribacterales bacterium]|nr:hypothetical protein [Candidatus Obscuribacterales bacterium]